MITRLVYSSKAVGGLDARQVEAILEVARRENQKLGITGMLLFDSQEFVQVLEGEDAAVNALFQKIAADPRHAAVELLVRDSGPARIFSQWAMAYALLDDDQRRRIGGTFDRKFARDFLSYMGRAGGYMKPLFRKFFDTLG